MTELVERYGWGISLAIFASCAVWLLGLIVLPLATMGEYSLRVVDTREAARISTELDQKYRLLRRLPRSDDLSQATEGAPAISRGELLAEIETLEARSRRVALGAGPNPRHYQDFLGNRLHLGIFFKTILVAAFVTAISAVLCYPIAYFMSRVAHGRILSLMLIALVVPYWLSEILRSFTWLLLLSDSGLVNAVLAGLGLVAQPVNFLRGDFGVIVGILYAYILFMVFPIYNVISTLDESLVECARDLGAPWATIHRRIIIPHARSGIVFGCIITFMFSAGSFAVPQILGGPDSLWFTQIIYGWFFAGGDWNRGATYSFVLLIVCLSVMYAGLKLFRISLRSFES